MIPSIGRIVHYTLTETDAESITRARINEIGGFFGNDAEAGQVYPLVITRVWSETDGGSVNGQVLLDGPDSLWVMSKEAGVGPGFWSEPPRVG